MEYPLWLIGAPLLYIQRFIHHPLTMVFCNGLSFNLFCFVYTHTHTHTQVCSTLVTSSSGERQRRQIDISDSSASGDDDVQLEYLRNGPVQFIVVGIGNTSANTAPELLLPTVPLTVTEGISLSDYQLEYSDEEGDEVEFFITSPTSLGVASLTLDGILTYTPCTYCNGLDNFEILIVEKPFGFNNIPLTASGLVMVKIENVNNKPNLYALDPLSMTGTDIIIDSELTVYVENNRTSPTSIAQIVAFDVDGYYDHLTISTQDGDNGDADHEIWLDIVNVLESLPVAALPNDVTYLGYVAFIGANITYKLQQYDYVGADTVEVIVRDSYSAFSQTKLIINIEVIPSFCLNGGVCNGSLNDPNCTDIEARKNSPESYVCSCVVGYSGQYCEVDYMISEPVDTRGVCFMSSTLLLSLSLSHTHTHTHTYTPCTCVYIYVIGFCVYSHTITN